MDNNILIKIKAEADMADAQVQLQDMTTKSKNLKQEMQNLIAIEEKYRAEQAQRVADGKGESEMIQKVIELKRKQRAELQQEINANERNIQSLKDVTSAYAATQGAGKRLAMQVRQIRDELAKMEMAGDTSSEAFIELSVQAAKLQDQVGDTQRQIAILASDTKNLDAAMSLGQGLAGAFNTATSAAALLGGESEALQEAFLKVQAAMAVLNGVQQVANTLNKDSAANVVIRTALTKLLNKEKAKEVANTTAATAASTADATAKGAETAATVAATTATKGFTAALLANPVTAIVAAVAALVAGIVALTKHMEEAAIKQRNFNGLLNETKTLMDRISNDTDYAARFAEAAGKGADEVYRIRLKGAKDALDIADKNYDEMEKRIGNNRKKMTDEEKEKEKELFDIREKAWDDYMKVIQDNIIRETAERTASDKKTKEDNKKAADDRKAAAKEAAEQELAYKREIEDINLSMMKEGRAKELRETITAFQRKINEIQGEGETEIALRKALAEKMNAELAKINEKYNQIDLNTAYTNQRDALTNQLNAHYKDLDARGLYLQQIAYLDKQHIEQTITDETAKANAIEAINIQLNKDLEDIQQQRADNAQAIIDEEKKQIAEMINSIGEIMSAWGDVINAVFDLASDRINQQLEDLENMYTTDAEEAQDNADKKYLTEKEYHDKEVALKRKQAQQEKAQAAFQIGLNTAQAIMRLWAEYPKDVSGLATTIALTAATSALGAVQLAAVLSKPLPQYAKGRKGGKGELALVGEKGAELMYVPEGASIIPNNKLDNPAAWAQYGVPQPDIETSLLKMALLSNAGLDYDRLGKTIAENMPAQKTVSVNIDRYGIGIYENGNSHRIHNQKYSGSWN